MAELTDLRVAFERQPAEAVLKQIGEAAAADEGNTERRLLAAFVPDGNDPEAIAGGVFGFISGSWSTSRRCGWTSRCGAKAWAVS